MVYKIPPGGGEVNHIQPVAYDFSCLADEIAKPRPDMNIKVAAFTVSEKSINTMGLLNVCKATHTMYIILFP